MGRQAFRASRVAILAAVVLAMAGCAANPVVPGGRQVSVPVAGPAGSPGPSPLLPVFASQSESAVQSSSASAVPSSPAPAVTRPPVVLRPAGPCRAVMVPRVVPYGSPEVSSLVLTWGVRRALLVAYASCQGIPRSDVAYGRDLAFYASDPVTGRYWAMAGYLPSRVAPLAAQVKFQDTASLGLFTRTAAGPWRVEVGGNSCSVEHFFPAAVLRAWSLLRSVSSVCRQQSRS
jgi:hypothetical protein